jgi:hypothetical protein
MDVQVPEVPEMAARLVLPQALSRAEARHEQGFNCAPAARTTLTPDPSPANCAGEGWRV